MGQQYSKYEILLHYFCRILTTTLTYNPELWPTSGKVVRAMLRMVKGKSTASQQEILTHNECLYTPPIPTIYMDDSFSLVYTIGQTPLKSRLLFWLHPPSLPFHHRFPVPHL